MEKYKVYKADEKEVTLWLNSSIPPFVITAFVALICVLRLIASTSFLNLILLIVLTVITYIVSNEIYHRGLFKHLFDDRLPDEITNDIEL